MAAPKRSQPPVVALLADLARYQKAYRAPVRGRNLPSNERGAKALVRTLRAIGDLGEGAAPALPKLAEFLNHPGAYYVPEEVRYWDWTMDDSCKEVVPAYWERVREAAVTAIGQVGPAAVPWLEAACDAPAPEVRELALFHLGDGREMLGVRSRGEELARRELDVAGGTNREAVAEHVCRCRMVGAPAPETAAGLIADPDPRVARAALELTYQRWPDLLTEQQQRGAAGALRAAVAARFRDPDPDLVAKALAALMNEFIASRAIEPEVRPLRAHPDPRVRQQAGNALATLDRLDPRPA